MRPAVSRRRKPNSRRPGPPPAAYRMTVPLAELARRGGTTEAEALERLARLDRLGALEVLHSDPDSVDVLLRVPHG